jgi:hypothetical protein
MLRAFSPPGAILNIMGRVLALTYIAALGFALSACGSHAVPKPPPKHPPEATQPSTKATPAEKRPRLIAPPPAYGNKIVMASGPRRTRIQ